MRSLHGKNVVRTQQPFRVYGSANMIEHILRKIIDCLSSELWKAAVKRKPRDVRLLTDLFKALNCAEQVLEELSAYLREGAFAPAATATYCDRLEFVTEELDRTLNALRPALDIFAPEVQKHSWLLVENDTSAALLFDHLYATTAGELTIPQDAEHGEPVENDSHDIASSPATEADIIALRTSGVLTIALKAADSAKTELRKFLVSNYALPDFVT